MSIQPNISPEQLAAMMEVAKTTNLGPSIVEAHTATEARALEESHITRLDAALQVAHAKIAKLEAIFDQLEAYFEERADAEYTPDRAAPVGNLEMSLLNLIQQARGIE